MGVHHDDALPWLAARPRSIECIITSLPDAAEMGWGITDWRSWFRSALDACFDALTITGAAIFYQTDRKAGGVWHSKASLVFESAAGAGVHVLWHKVVLRRSPGTHDLHRPTYAHLIATSPHPGPGATTPDVIAPTNALYGNGMPLGAAGAAVGWAAAHGYRNITDPFCGHGTVLYVARSAGLSYTGVDIDAGQVAATEELLAQTVLLTTAAHG